jgi:hypothetical protein
LPEAIGGGRNWDYRYTWVRDASLTMAALWVAACPTEAGRFFTFLADAAATQLRRGADLQIMFGVGGEHDLSERELPHLAGWRASKPVRVGNGAWNQRQLDVYGELLGAAQRLAEKLGTLDPVTQQFLAAAADTAASRWTEKDQGIWEIRGEPRDFLYSKLMCWVALDRAIALAARLNAEDRVREWAAARDEIRAAILEHGWNEKAGAYTQAFGSEDLDASSLMLAITGFLPGDDPRAKATADAIAARLTDQRGLVYRYLAKDGLAGEEGTFLLCTFWLAQAQALAGEHDRATATFERAVAAINDVGLLAEEVDQASGEMIGNFPQAFSHIGLVNAAWAIAQARERAAGPPPEKAAGPPPEKAAGRLGEGLELQPDLVGLRVPQVLEDGPGLFPGVTRGVVIAGGVMRVAEAGERHRLLVKVPDRAEKTEGLAVALDGLPVVAEVVVGVAEAVQRFRLPGLVAEVALQGQGTLAVAQGPLAHQQRRQHRPLLGLHQIRRSAPRAPSSGTRPPVRARSS